MATATVPAPGCAGPRAQGRRAVRTTVLVGLAVNLLPVLLALAAFGTRADWFVKFGHEGSYTPVAREVLGDDVRVPLDDGHDGQGYWLQARDPALLHGSADARAFDRPAYRAQRMLYPTLAAPFRLLGENALLQGLVLVNLAVVGLGTYAATRLAMAAGGPAKAGLAFALNPLVAVAVLMDFGDALALAALVGTLWMLRERRFWPALGLAVAAALAKEVSLLPLAALAITGVAGLTTRRRVQLLAAPTAAVVSWALYARWRLGWPASQIEEFSAVPLWGYLDSYRRGWSQAGNWFDAVVAAALLVVAVVVVVRFRHRRTPELAVALPFALLVPFLSANVVDLALNSFRVLGPALTFAVIDWYADPASRRLVAEGSLDEHWAR